MFICYHLEDSKKKLRWGINNPLFSRPLVLSLIVENEEQSWAVFKKLKITLKSISKTKPTHGSTGSWDSEWSAYAYLGKSNLWKERGATAAGKAAVTSVSALWRQHCIVKRAVTQRLVFQQASFQQITSFLYLRT